MLDSHFRLCTVVVCAPVSGELFAVLMEAKGQLWVSSAIILYLILETRFLFTLVYPAWQ